MILPVETAKQTNNEVGGDCYACAENADALVIVTEWEQFRALDFERLKAVMRQAVLVDLRNVYRPEELEVPLA